MSATLEQIEQALSRARGAPTKATPVFKETLPSRDFAFEREERRVRAIEVAAERVAKQETERRRRDFERRGVRP